jgi:hypothetical protein
MYACSIWTSTCVYICTLVTLRTYEYQCKHTNRFVCTRRQWFHLTPATHKEWCMHAPYEPQHVFACVEYTMYLRLRPSLKQARASFGTGREWYVGTRTRTAHMHAHTHTWHACARACTYIHKFTYTRATRVHAMVPSAHAHKTDIHTHGTLSLRTYACVCKRINRFVCTLRQWYRLTPTYTYSVTYARTDLYSLSLNDAACKRSPTTLVTYTLVYCIWASARLCVRMVYHTLCLHP